MSFVKGVISLIIFSLNTIVLVPILLVFSLLKLIIPWRPWRRFMSSILVGTAELWISVNYNMYKLIHGNKVQVIGDVELSPDDWYLVISNHQTMADIPIIQGALNKKIPFLRFFLKQELIWVPLLGLAWWALDFPFMQRFSREYLQKNPHMRGKDMEKTRQSCEKFKDFPTSIFNFVEGTRFTQAKFDRQDSEFKHVLKPKAGGVGYVLGSMGEQLNHLLLVTLQYQPSVPGMWSYLCGQVDSVKVYLEKVKIPTHLLQKNYLTDERFRQELFEWLNVLWHKVDNNLSTHKA